MEVVLKDVEAAMSTMTDAEKAHYQQQLAGLNHGKTFSAMINGLGDEYDDLKESIINSDGALLEMRNTMKDKIGRASCREREKMTVGDGRGEKKGEEGA